MTPPGICEKCKHPQGLHPADRGRRCISPLCDCEGFVGEELAPRMEAQVAGEPPLETDDPLIVLIYILLRDHIQPGIFERLVNEMVAAPVTLTNPFLAAYAVNIAIRFRALAPLQTFTLTTAEREGIEDCISIASRMASSYDTYGGVELPGAIEAARSALARMDEDLPLPTDETAEAEKVRLQLADLLAQGRKKLLMDMLPVETREHAREALMEADKIFEAIFEAFAPERWKQELAEWDSRHGDAPEPGTGVEES